MKWAQGSSRCFGIRGVLIKLNKKITIHLKTNSAYGVNIDVNDSVSGYSTFNARDSSKYNNIIKIAISVTIA
jgi:hypothetical protein